MKIIGKIMLGMLLFSFGLMTVGAGVCAISSLGQDATLATLGALFFCIFASICWAIFTTLIAPIKSDTDEPTR